MTKEIKTTPTLITLLRAYLKAIVVLITLLSIFLLLFFFILPTTTKTNWSNHIQVFLSIHFFIYIIVGFFAQMIDGALGMAYGISSTSFLMSVGVSPAVASASVHIAEVVTTGVSGFAHWKMGNVSKKLFWELAIPGAIGAILGAYVLVSFEGNTLKPFISTYLLIMGFVIIYKALKKTMKFKKIKKVKGLALLGGFVDASGGGGWGPIVTTTFLGSGANPKLTIGTVNASEFVVALTSSSVFTFLMGVNDWRVILGLILGGIIAAPFGAFICHKVNVKFAMFFVGALIITLSVLSIYKFFS